MDLSAIQFVTRRMESLVVRYFFRVEDSLSFLIEQTSIATPRFSAALTARSVKGREFIVPWMNDFVSETFHGVGRLFTTF